MKSCGLALAALGMLLSLAGCGSGGTPETSTVTVNAGAPVAPPTGTTGARTAGKAHAGSATTPSSVKGAAPSASPRNTHAGTPAVAPAKTRNSPAVSPQAAKEVKAVYLGRLEGFYRRTGSAHGKEVILKAIEKARKEK